MFVASILGWWVLTVINFGVLSIAFTTTTTNEPTCLPLDNNTIYIARAGDYEGALPEHAWQCHEEGKYTAAITEWQRAIREDPNDPGNHLSLGVDYQRIGNARGAVTEWKKGLDLLEQPEPILPDPTRADKQFIAKDYTAALKSLGNIITGDGTEGPDYDRISAEDTEAPKYLNKAIKFLEDGQFESALAPLKRAEALDANLFPTYLLLGDTYYVLGNKNSAIFEWEQTLFSFYPVPQMSAFRSSHVAAIQMLIHYVGR